MKKLLLSLLAMAALLGAANLQSAQDEAKPLAAVSFSGYDKLVANINAVGSLGGNPHLAGGLEMMVNIFTQGKGLAGLDTKRPWAAVVMNSSQQPLAVYGFLPVSDLKQLVGIAKGNPQLAELIRQSDDIYEIQASAQTLYVQQKGTWAVVVNKRELLGSAPADPLKLIGDLPERFDVAARVFVDNIPAEYRDALLAQLRAGAEAGMAQMPQESPAEHAGRIFGARQTLEQIIAVVNEAQDVTVGWAIDAKASVTHLDFEITGKAGTPLAERFEQIKPGKSSFAGFVMPDAAVSAVWTGTLTDADVAQAKSALGVFRKMIAENPQLQKLGKIDPKRVAGWIDAISGVVEKTLDTKKRDGGMAVLLAPTAVTFVAGGALADGEKLETVLKEIAEELRKNNPEAAKGIKFDVASHQGVRLHKIEIPNPPSEIAPFVGDPMELAIGFADDKALLAFGRDAEKVLRRVIEKSEAQAGKIVPPLAMRVSTAAIAKFIAQVAEDEQAKATAAVAVGILDKAGDKDHVVMVVTPIAEGIRVRLKLEEGLLKALASFGQAVNPMGGTPPADHAPGN